MRLKRKGNLVPTLRIAEKRRTTLKIKSDQLVMEVVAIMFKLDINTLPIYCNQSKVGTITFSEILEFLMNSKNNGVLCHTLNFEIETLLRILREPGRQHLLAHH